MVKTEENKDLQKMVIHIFNNLVEKLQAHNVVYIKRGWSRSTFHLTDPNYLIKVLMRSREGLKLPEKRGFKYVEGRRSGQKHDDKITRFGLKK